MIPGHPAYIQYFMFDRVQDKGEVLTTIQTSLK